MTRGNKRFKLVSLTLCLSTHCGDSKTLPVVYKLDEKVTTSLQQIWAPFDPPKATFDAMHERSLRATQFREFADYGFQTQLEAGEVWFENNDLAKNYSHDTHALEKSLLYFWWTADPQIIDEESPIRFAGTDVLPMVSTYRPQEHVAIHVFEAHVRTAARISQLSGRPFDFAFVGGDLTDGGQENELHWSLTALAGGTIDPDSGRDDDPVPGPGNDYNDPFTSDGIGVPFYVTLGNHETLYTGVFPATQDVQVAAIGNEVFPLIQNTLGIEESDGFANGYRDGRTQDGNVVTHGKTPKDNKRRILDRYETLATIFSTNGEPEHHGLTAENVAAGNGYYSFFPHPGKPLRFIVLNTLTKISGTFDRGYIDMTQYEWLVQELQTAAKQNELVLVGAHHPQDMMDSASPISGSELENLLLDYSNVVAMLVGHGHENRRQLIKKSTHRGYWELMVASTVDFPTQTRMIELVLEQPSVLKIYSTVLDHNAAPESLAFQARLWAMGRRYLTLHYTRANWQATLSARNMLLRIQIPEAIDQTLRQYAWPERIESIETLAKL